MKELLITLLILFIGYNGLIIYYIHEVRNSKNKENYYGKDYSYR